MQAETLDEEEREPPVPAGLGELTPAQRAFVDFMNIDQDLLDAAVAGHVSSPAHPLTREEIARGLRTLSGEKKDNILERLVTGDDPHVGVELLQHLEKLAGKQASPAASGFRTVGKLLALAESRRQERIRRETERRAAERAHQEQARAQTRAKHLEQLASREAEAWQKVDTLIAARKPGEYDKAVALLVDLREVATGAGRKGLFDNRLIAIRQEHARKPSLIERMKQSWSEGRRKFMDETAKRLGKLDRDALLSLLRTLLAEQPGLIGKVELLLATLPSAPAKPAPKPTAPTIDVNLFRCEALGIMGSSRGGRHRYHDYGETSAVVNELDGLLSRIRSLLDEDDGLNALVALETIMEVMMEQWHDYDDSDGELGQTFDELGALFAEAILRADPTGEERENWQEQLETWRDELAEYGCEEGFATACRAVADGWREPGEHTLVKDNQADDPLTRMRLNILESREEHEAFLRLALASDAHDAHVLGLVRLGRLEESERVTREQIRHPHHVLLIAQALQESGDTARALRIAEWGVFREDAAVMEGRHFIHALAVWLRDLARESGAGDLARRAESAAFSATWEMDDWLAAQDLAGETWPSMREELLARMAATKAVFPDRRIAVYLHEGLIAEAVREADGERFYSNHDLLRRLMKAAMTSHPDWVIRRSRKEAEEIMDAGRANAYDSAAEWLGFTRQAFFHNDRSAEWTALIHALIQRHTRKYKLRPLLEKLK